MAALIGLTIAETFPGLLTQPKYPIPLLVQVLHRRTELPRHITILVDEPVLTLPIEQVVEAALVQ